MTRRKVGIAAAVAAVVVLVFWLWPRGEDAGAGHGAGADGAERTARSRAELAQAYQDRSPSRIGGRVIDERGAGVDGAVVSLSEKSLDAGAHGRPGQSPTPITAVTDGAGRFAIAGVPAGRYAVAATARGYVPGVIEDVRIRPRDDRDDLTITVTAGGHSLTGKVTDIGGGPVPGAIVQTAPLSDASILDWPWATFTAITDSDGHYELTLADGIFGVAVSHPDYVGQDGMVEIRGADREKSFELIPGAVVYGRVIVRGTDEPVAAALVTDVSKTQGFHISGVGFGGVVTDPQGKFELRGLGSGVLELRAVAPGYTSRQSTPVELGIGEQVTGVVVLVDEAHTISGTVVRKGRPDEPVEGVMVGAYNFNPGALLVSVGPSSGDGYFEIYGVPDGTYVLGGLGEEQVPNFSSTSVTVDGEDISDVVIEMDPGVNVRGRVEPPQVARIRVDIDPDSVSFASIMPTLQRALLSANADATGAFEMKAVTPGKYVISAEGEDGSKGKTEVEVGDADVDGVLIRLAPRAFIAGRVVDEDGSAVADARVQVQRKDGDRTFSSLGLADFARMGAGHPTGPDGSFRIPGVDEGTHLLTVSDEIGRLAWADPKRADEKDEPLEVQIQGTQPVEGLELVVEARDGVIRGVVLGPDNAPIADAWVTARREGGRRWRGRRGGRRDRDRDRAADGAGTSGEPGESRTVTVSVGSSGSKVESSEDGGDSDTDGERGGGWSEAQPPVLTDAEGRFAIEGLRDGSYDLSAEGLKGSARGETRGVRVGTSGAVIRLEPLAGITGKVSYRGEPVQEYTLNAIGPTDRRTHVIDDEGRYQVNRLDPGGYEVAVHSARGSARGEVEVESSRTATLDLALVPWGAVSGRVVHANTGDPLPELVVFAMSEDQTDFSEMAMNLLKGDGPRTGPDGQFRVGKLPAGKGSVVVIDGDAGGFQLVATREFELAPGQELDLGELRGVPADDVPEDERGTLGLTTTTAAWESRPLAEDADRDATAPAGLDPAVEHLWVAGVDEGGPAAEAGVERGDRITAINGAPTQMVGADVARQMLQARRIRAGDQVQLEYERDGSRSTVTLTAAAAAND